MTPPLVRFASGRHWFSNYKKKRNLDRTSTNTKGIGWHKLQYDRARHHLCVHNGSGHSCAELDSSGGCSNTIAQRPAVC